MAADRSRRRVVAGGIMMATAIAGLIVAFEMRRSGYDEFKGICGAVAFVSACVGVAGVGVSVSLLALNVRLFLMAMAACLFFLPALVLLARSHHLTSRSASRHELAVISKALDCYRSYNGGYFPYDERGPLESLSLLYPHYMATPRIFRSDYLHYHLGHRSEGPFFPEGTPFAGAPCHFGYTWRVPRDVPGDFVIIADKPGVFLAKGATPGFSVGAVDGSVRWVTDPHCSHDPNDNIYAPQPGWSPDTDTFIRTAR